MAAVLVHAAPAKHHGGFHSNWHRPANCVPLTDSFSKVTPNAIVMTGSNVEMMDATHGTDLRHAGEEGRYRTAVENRAIC
jgi:hypothetical protein